MGADPRDVSDAGGWRGILVEPVPHIFERLAARHAGTPRLTLERCAIAETPGELTFYHLAPSDDASLPPWYDQLGSFSRDQVLKHRTAIPDIEQRLVEIQVPSLSLRQLCERHAVERIDLLHVDAEGYDFQILKMLDFRQLPPSTILFEHLHLSAGERQAAAELLQGHGYRLHYGKSDCFAARTADFPAAAPLWRRWPVADDGPR